MNLHFFNPGHEVAVLNESPYYTLPANPLKMQRDLAYLPAWYAVTEDWVWIYDLLPDDFIQSLSALNPLPRAICRENLTKYKSELSGSVVTPWGISPQILFEAGQLNTEWDLNARIPEWNADYKKISGRQIAKECLEDLVFKLPEISPEILPQFFTEFDEIEQFILTNPKPLLIKAPYSSSGRGLLWVSEEELGKSGSQILRGILKKQGSASIEKALDKQLDLAMEFFVSGENQTEFKAYSLFRTDSKGAYCGNSILSQEEMLSRIETFIDPELIEKVKNQLIHFFNCHFLPAYRGCIGVDMLVYREGDAFRLHPCVEINARYNMGWLAFHFYDRFCKPNASGFFQIDFFPETGMALRQHLALQERYPPVFSGGRIESGYLSLCPVSEDTCFLASVRLES